MKNPPEGRITPRRMPSDPEMETDPAPEERWDCDILEDEGERRFREMVDTINRECTNLNL